VYEVEGITLDGQELESEIELTHLMPAPPEPTINGTPAAEDCDAVLPVVGSGDPVTISWAAVTMSHPDLGSPRSSTDIVIHNYEVVVEIDGTPFRTHIILPPGVTSFLVPSEILLLAETEGEGEVKFEVLAREESFNQTAVESCFEIEE
jgi:hypothetical protein